jgi:hypothetical protein
MASSHAPRAKFTRTNMGAVVMPDPLRSKEDIFAYHQQNGTLTHAFTLSVASSQASGTTAVPARPSPLGPASPAAVHTVQRGRVQPSPPRPGSSLNPDHHRISRVSFNPGFTLVGTSIASSKGERPISIISWCPPSPLGSTFSVGHARVASVAGSLASLVTGPGVAERTVRQTFTPVLPDELLVRAGERLSVVQTLDDGWCVVGRTGAGAAAAPTPGDAAFGHAPAPDGIEMGVVPAWVFARIGAERPMRTTSLGVTVQVPAPAGVREDVMSWSNF